MTINDRIKMTPLEAEKLVELTKRKVFALNIFRSQEHQDAMLSDLLTQNQLVRGGNRCQPEDTVAWRVTKKTGKKISQAEPVKIKDVSIGDKLYAFSDGPRQMPLVATVLNKTEFKESAIKITTKRGYELEGTFDHPVMVAPPITREYHNASEADYSKQQWMEMKDVPVGWYVKLTAGPLTGWSGDIDEDAYFHGLMDGDGSVTAYKYGVMKLAGHRDESLNKWASDYLENKGIRSRLFHRGEGHLGTSLEWCNLAFKDNYLKWDPELTPEVMAGYIRGLFDADGHISSERKAILVQVDIERLKKVREWLLLFGIKASLYTSNNPKHPEWSEKGRLQISGRSFERFVHSIGCDEESKKLKCEQYRKPSVDTTNKVWWDVVRSSDKTEVKNIVGLTTSSGTYISNGFYSHNSGKSLLAAVKGSACILDKEITLSDGTKVPGRRPSEKGKKLTVFIIAYDSSNIGRNIHRLLFQKGAFKVIRDKKTRQWVAFDYENPDHKSREAESQPSPPLIPASYIKPKTWAWEEKTSKIFKSVTIWDPETKEDLADIFAFSSKAEAPQGTPVHYIWVDEQLANEDYEELRVRLTDYNGRIVWSTWPRPDEPELLRVWQLCVADEQKDNPLYRCYTFTTSANKQIDPEGKRSTLEGMDPETRKARDLGEFSTESLRSYPLFAPDIHRAYKTCSQCEKNSNSNCQCKDDDDELARILRANRGEPPADWTREMILDPGTENPAVLFCAVPPDHIGDYRVVYNELVPGRKDAMQLAPLIRSNMGQFAFQRFIIDYHAGRTKPMSFGLTIADNYAKAFSANGVRCVNSGHNLTYGSDDVGGRIMEVQSWLHLNDEDVPRPKLRIVGHRCPNLCKQMVRVMKKVIKKEVVDDRHADRQRIDTVHCLEYWAASKPRYIKPPKNHASLGNAAYQFFQKWKKRNAKKNEKSEETLGPQYEQVGSGKDF